MENTPNLLGEIEIQTWEKLLFDNNDAELNMIENDLDIINVVLDLPNQKTIKSDCDRTRVKEESQVKNFREHIEKLLTYYLKKYKITYKQGLNEVIAPFILIKSYVPMTLSRIIKIFTLFVNKYLRNYYHESEIYCLQSSLSLLKILLKYHDPDLWFFFEFSLIFPEMYATPWLMTMFASKSKFDIIIYLWNQIIKENDELLIHFIMVALLIKNRQILISTDLSQIPIKISMLCMQSEDEVNDIFKIALNLREHTPYSFRILSDHLGIYSYKKINRLKYLNEYFKPHKMISLPIFISEVLYITFKDLVDCPDENCINFQKSMQKLYSEDNDISVIFDDDNDEIYDQDDRIEHQLDIKNNCFSCMRKEISVINNSITKELTNSSFVLLDLRMLDQETSTSGFLPLSIILDNTDFTDPNFAEDLVDKYDLDKGKYHFMMITSETYYFQKYEDLYYMEKSSVQTRKNMMYGIQTRLTRILNEKEVSKLKSLKEEMRFNEYNYFRQLIKNFLSKKFPYISFIFGGFNEIHNYAKKYHIPLLGHDQCMICRATKLKLAKKKQRKLCVIDKLFDWVRNSKYNKLERTSNLRKLTDTSKVKQDDKMSDLTKSLTMKSRNKKAYSLFDFEKNLFTIQEISQISNDKDNSVFKCIFEESKYGGDKNENNSKKHNIIYITNEYLRIFMLKSAKHDQLFNYNIIEKIYINDIQNIITKTKEKHIVQISYFTKENIKAVLIINLITNEDSRSFISKVKKILKNKI